MKERYLRSAGSLRRERSIAGVLLRDEFDDEETDEEEDDADDENEDEDEGYSE